MTQMDLPTTTPPTSAHVRIPPGFYYFAGLGLGVAIDRVAAVPFPVAGGGVVRVGAFCLAAGSAVVLVSVLSLWMAGTPVDPMKPTRALVTRGIYRLSRNPNYVGLAIGYIGAALLVGSLSSLLLLPGILMIFQCHVIPREERYLQQLLGHAYAEYLSRVRRWL